MKKQIKAQPLTTKQIIELNKNCSSWSKLALNTGLRLNELSAAAKAFNGENYVDIERKNSKGQKVRIYLNENAIQALDSIAMNLRVNVSTKTIQRAINVDIENVVPYGEEINCHRLRATFATTAINNGVNIAVLQVLMNHADISQTAQYFKISDLSQYSAIEVIGNVYSGKFDSENPQFLLQEISRLREENAMLKNILSMKPKNE